MLILENAMDKVSFQIKAQLAILNAFSYSYFSLHKQFLKLKCHMYNSNILYVGLSKTDNPAKSWTIEDPVSNYPDRCVPRKSFCNLFFVLFMKFTPQVSTPHRPVVCHKKCNCSKPEQPKIEVDRSHFTLSLNISAVYYTPAVILLSLLSE